MSRIQLKRLEDSRTFEYFGTGLAFIAFLLLSLVCFLKVSNADGQIINPTVSNYAPASVAITGGTINNATIGATTANSIRGTTGTFTSTLAVTGTTTVTGGIVGTTAGGNATAGNTGEVITATVPVGSAVTLATGVTSNVTSIALTHGDWDCDANVDFADASATSTNYAMGISLTSATLPTQPGGSGLGTDPLINMPLNTTALSTTVNLVLPSTRFNSSTASTTVYLVANETFSAGGSTAYGTIYCRRQR